jgi:hypothetical protein
LLKFFVNWNMASNKSYGALYTVNSEYFAIVPFFKKTRLASREIKIVK